MLRSNLHAHISRLSLSSPEEQRNAEYNQYYIRHITAIHLLYSAPLKLSTIFTALQYVSEELFFLVK
jgi:hypothetical protein